MREILALRLQTLLSRPEHRVARGAQRGSARFDGAEFGGMILPFGCPVDFFPTPARNKTRRSQKDDVVLGDGEG